MSPGSGKVVTTEASPATFSCNGLEEVFVRVLTRWKERGGSWGEKRPQVGHQKYPLVQNKYPRQPAEFAYKTAVLAETSTAVRPATSGASNGHIVSRQGRVSKLVSSFSRFDMKSQLAAIFREDRVRGGGSGSAHPPRFRGGRP